MATRVGLVQLGCAKNQVDGEEILGALVGIDHTSVNVVAKESDADILVINTCGFIESAKEESINAILAAVKRKQKGQVEKVIVTGCLAQRYASELALEIPEVDAFLGIESAPQIGNVVFGPRLAQPNQVDYRTEKYPLVPHARLRASATPWTAYLKISEGCDHPCTFCAIPGIRGRHRSKPIERLVAEATQLVESGAIELNLVAQDTTAYGIDLYGRLALPELLGKLAEIPKLHWIRLLYCYPTMVRPALIDTIRDIPQVLPYIDMPLQHGSDSVLKRMKRGGSSSQYRRLFESLRLSIPDIAIRTTFLVGFPGETDEEFDELLSFVDEMRFDRVGVFTYSAEEGTPAYAMPDQVSTKTMSQRKEALMLRQQQISLDKNKQWVGRKIEIIVEQRKGDNVIGRSFRDAPEIDGVVIVKGSNLVPGTLTKVQIVDSDYYDLTAQEIVK